MKYTSRFVAGSLITTLFICLAYTQAAHAQYNGQADAQAIVRAGNARFTVLTPRLIRLEWDSAGQFNNQPSFVVVNRKLPVPPITKEIKNGWLYISTSEMELHYQLQSGKFNEQNCEIVYHHGGTHFTWKPGITESGNLKGTYRTLDGCEADHNYWRKEDLKLEDGLLSTDGWHLIDDSKSLLFDNSEWPWVVNPATANRQDWYFLGYGTNYKQALYDYSQIAGKVPLPPRYAFGYWWSRYWSYSDNEIHDLVNNFEKFNIPLDVLVIDMDWHSVVNERQPWTGWTWNTRLFPDPDKCLSWVKSKNLKTTLNLHPADGIASYESQYASFAKAMQFDTTSHTDIPFEASNKKYMRTLFDTVLHPMEKKGVDFWWLDWQQWPMDKKITNMSNTWWLNYCFFSDRERNSDKRPLIYHRWGGLGNHRYQIGFSGDVIISWKSLDYQPYFTNCASNVLYAYWSHDIGGHYFNQGDGDKGIDPELYTRWMQYGALSPVFRTHSSKDGKLNKEIWNYRGEVYNALTASINLRYQLLPYIYTMARKTYDSSISICRPLYYDYSDQAESYTYPKEYMFGDNILVTPIGTPMKDGATTVRVWLPKGTDWYEWNTGTLLPGGQTVERSFTIEEYPVYVKAGAIIPMYEGVKNLDNNPGKIVVGIFPGTSGKTLLYEDAGNDKYYAREYATTQLESSLQNRRQRIVIYPRKGAYKGMPANRTYVVKLFGAEMPQSVTINGKAIDYTQLPDSKRWSYDGKTFTVTIPLPVNVCSVKQEVVVQYSKTDSANVNTGLIKTFRVLPKATTGLKYRDANLIVPEVIGNCEETNLKLQYDPSGFYRYIEYFNQHYPEIPDAIQKAAISNEHKEWFIKQVKN